MFIGVDLGMGACKLAGPAGMVHLPSHVSIADGRIVGRLAGMRSRKPPLKIAVGGHSFYVGDGAHDFGRPIESVDYDRLTGSPEMLAIFYGALTRYLQQGGSNFEPVTLLVGMPLEPLTGEDAGQTVAAVRSWMVGGHEWLADGEPYRLVVDEARVTSQAAGALFDYLLDGDGRFIPERKAHIKKEIGIVSVGFNTVELLVVQDTRPVNRFTAGSTSGARRLLELVNGDGLYSLGELDGQLRAGSLDIKTAVPVWAREVSGAIERTWGRAWRRFASIVVVGGGALILNGQLDFAGRAVVPEQPVMSIARGLYKLGLMQAQRRSEAK